MIFYYTSVTKNQKSLWSQNKFELDFISKVQLQIPSFTLFTDFPLDCDLSDKTVGRGIAVYLSQKLKAVSQDYFIN